MLERLDFVMWDRYVNPTDGEYHFYGWIKREDNYKDFVVLSYLDGRWWYITSSEQYTHIIAEIVDGSLDEHSPCIRVEANFRIKNKIEL